jgi:signal transduction histidine kinase
MRLRSVLRQGRIAVRSVVAKMRGDPFAFEENLHRLGCGPYLDPLMNISVRDAVVVLRVGDMVVDVHPGANPLGHLERLDRQRQQSRPVQLFEHLPTALPQMLHHPVVELVQKRPETKIPEGHIGIRKHISMPIMFHGKVIGLLLVANKETDCTEADIRSLETIAGQIAPVLIARLQRERAERELQEKNAELERFVYTISHDLKSPLVTVKTFLGYLEQDLPGSDTERIKKDMLYMRTAADKMGQLLDELLEMSRIGRIANPPVLVTFRELVEEALTAVAGPITERGVKVQVSDPPITLYGDRPRPVEIWQNLVENVAKFMGDQASPRIEIVRRNLESSRLANWLIQVADGQAALDYLYRRAEFSDPERSPRPGIVLLDLRLPKVDGLEVLKTIKSDPDLRRIPVVILTTSAAEADIVKAYDSYANSYLVKPVDFSQFVKLMDTLG